MDEKTTEIACLERDLVKLSGEKNEVSFSDNHHQLMYHCFRYIQGATSYFWPRPRRNIGFRFFSSFDSLNKLKLLITRVDIKRGT